MKLLYIIYFFIISVPVCLLLLLIIEIRFFIRVVLVFLGHDKGKYPAVSTVGDF